MIVKQKIISLGMYPDMLVRIDNALQRYQGMSRAQFVANAVEAELARLEQLEFGEDVKVEVNQAVASARNLVRS